MKSRVSVREHPRLEHASSAQTPHHMSGISVVGLGTRKIVAKKVFGIVRWIRLMGHAKKPALANQAGFFLLALLSANGLAVADEVRFNQDVRPILSNRALSSWAESLLLSSWRAKILVKILFATASAGLTMAGAITSSTASVVVFSTFFILFCFDYLA